MEENNDKLQELAEKMIVISKELREGFMILNGNNTSNNISEFDKTELAESLKQNYFELKKLISITREKYLQEPQVTYKKYKPS